MEKLMVLIVLIVVAYIVFTKLPGESKLSPEEDTTKQEVFQETEKLDPIETAVQKAAKKYDLDPSLIHAVIKQESDYNPKAVSKSGARGLMQLMPPTAKMLGVTDSFDIEQNVDGGSRHLRNMLKQFGTIELALAAYNAGGGRVIQAGYKIPNIRETQHYVKIIMKNYRKDEVE